MVRRRISKLWLLLQLASAAMLLSLVAGQANQSEKAANAVQTAIYESQITLAAVERQYNERIKKQRRHIEDLSNQVALAQEATGAAEQAAMAVQRELREAQAAFVADLAARDRAYAEEIRIFRNGVEDIASTPEGIAALEIYNAGDRQRARAILKDLRAARDQARQRRANIESAAEARSIATLELDMKLKGELTVDDLIASFEEITELDPGVHWDWVELRRLYVDAGDLNKAHSAAERSLETAADERDRSVALNELGDVQVAQGDLTAALNSYQEGLNIAQQLAKRDPGNTGWQRDLSVSFEKIGNVKRDQGDLTAALNSYQDSLEIRRRLAKRDPGNTGWQRDLSVSFNKIGDVQVAQGDLTAALNSYQEDLNIAQQLAERDPGNTGWQRDLSVSFNKIGDVQRDQGDLTAALNSYQEGLNIAQQLAKRDPGNTGWQRDLIVSNVKLAQMGDQPAERYFEALSIAQALYDSGRLRPTDTWMLADLQRRLDEATD